ncbi:MAG: dihydropteroate synthase-like protein [Methanosphaera sp.]|nr:dihydropteroate synthase-like protein [Methanosphaera sp.]
MKILIVTGQLAADIIRKNLMNYDKHELYLKVLPMSIAAFLTPKMIVYYVKQKNILESIDGNKTTPIDNIDIIITPGLMQQDTTEITEELHIPSYKGPTNAADLELTLDIVDNMTLSTTRAANILIRDQQYQRAMSIINNYDNNDDEIRKLLDKDCNYMVGNVAIGLDFPMRILGEIANSPSLSDDQLLERVAYYIDSGADMIDIGMHANDSDPKLASHMIKLIKDNYDVTVSIDTLNPSEIKAGLTSGADMVLSLDHGNYDKVICDLADYEASAVILPTNYSKNIIPYEPLDRVKSLERLDELCDSITTIADPLLDPLNSPSTTKSIVTCNLYRERNPTKPLFFGVGNVSELLDADSNGVHALLSGIGMELDVSILFSPEASLKTKGAISELKKARDMMFISKIKETIPKNLGIDLIELKDAYSKDDLCIDTSGLPHIEAQADGKFTPDYKGSFKIIVEDNLIKAILYINMKPNMVIEATTARAIYEEILRRDLISRMEHSAYLGMELEKAEIALKLDKKYVQDFPVF